jgi:hypothetical protein
MKGCITIISVQANKLEGLMHAPAAAGGYVSLVVLALETSSQVASYVLYVGAGPGLFAAADTRTHKSRTSGPGDRCSCTRTRSERATLYLGCAHGARIGRTARGERS